ncbi:hypothetical protein [Methanolobus halotolerans]|uniref:Uncharacterized protein n=1 Tax=Methanolobus halotolerans TaxID=2052935 RepID=A0A4E0QT71_9EURY|nr:hypothetical protein [Methanolobus halotolerans]TGC11011.1 hypothetical protein CUN85_02325 [Methanolobus halotolerans]
MVGEQFFSWISENATTITPLTNIITVVIWGFYAHLLYREYRNQNYPRILIQQSQGTSNNSLCLLTNLSEKMMDVTCIFAVGYGKNNKVYKKKIEDYGQFDTNKQIEQSQSIQRRNFSHGSRICVGKFNSLLQKLNLSDISSIEKLEIRVVAFFAYKDEAIGASRFFSVKSKQDGSIVQITPENLKTKQMRSFLQKRKIRNWTEDCFNEDVD